MDVVLAERPEAYMGETLQPARKLRIGARRATQTMDIAQFLSLVLETSPDRRSQGAVAQYDIATYYDTIWVMMVVRDAGAGAPLMAVVVRHQLWVSVSLSVGFDQYADIPQTISGALTGSRVAGQLGHWPVEMSMRIEMTDPTARG